MANDPDSKRLLWFVFAGSRGGLNRLRIISILKKTPLNTNQLAKEMSLDYKAIQHHIKVLEKNNMVTKVGEKYKLTFPELTEASIIQTANNRFYWVHPEIMRAR